MAGRRLDARRVSPAPQAPRRRHGSRRGLFVSHFRQHADELLGGITLGGVRRGVSQSGTLGYWMGAPHAGKGRMTRAVAATAEFALTRSCGCTGSKRPASRKIPPRSRSSSATASSARATRAAFLESTGRGATTSCSGWSKATRVRDWRGPILTERILNDRLGALAEGLRRQAGEARFGRVARPRRLGAPVRCADGFMPAAFAVESVRVSPDRTRSI